MEIQAIEVRFLFALFVWFIVCPANEASSCYVLCFKYYAFEHSRSNWNFAGYMVRAQNRTRATSLGDECSHHCSPISRLWTISLSAFATFLPLSCLNLSKKGTLFQCQVS